MQALAMTVVRSMVGLVLAFTAGVLTAFVGLAITVSGQDKLAGFLVLLLGLYITLAAPVLHDRAHREHGEEPHALWGRGERFKPSWWPRRRPS